MGRISNTKTCCCPYCGKMFHHMGIARHRAVCRKKRVDVANEKSMQELGLTTSPILHLIVKNKNRNGTDK